jgi:hypothetical protein
MMHSYLDVKDIKVDGEKVKWDVTPRTEPYGSPISVKVGKDVAKDKEIEVTVSANTFFHSLLVHCRITACSNVSISSIPEPISTKPNGSFQTMYPLS